MQRSDGKWTVFPASYLLGWRRGSGLQGVGDFPHCFTEIHINFWLKFQSSLLWPLQGRATQSLQQRQWFHSSACLIPEELLLLSSFEKQNFEVCFSVFVLKLYCFFLSSKPRILLKGIFWLKRNLFCLFVCLFCQTLFPEQACAILLAVLGAWFDPLQGHKKQQAGPAPSWGHWLGVLSWPCHISGMLVTGRGTELLLADHKLPLFCLS